MEASNIITQTIDKTQVPPLHQKRILAFVNHFITSTCSFLNEFALKCEERFIEIERKMQKVEAALTIIEMKLASIPDSEPTSAVVVNSSIKTEEPSKDTASPEEPPVANTVPELIQTAPSDSLIKESEPSAKETSTGIKACDDVRYKKFFKMVQFGVPLSAVKLKMQSEGILPDILDTPNRILPDGISS